MVFGPKDFVLTFFRFLQVFLLTPLSRYRRLKYRYPPTLVKPPHQYNLPLFWHFNYHIHVMLKRIRIRKCITNMPGSLHSSPGPQRNIITTADCFNVQPHYWQYQCCVQFHVLLPFYDIEEIHPQTNALVIQIL